VPVAGQLTTPALYGVALTVPATSSTAIALGRVPKYLGPPAISGAAANGNGVVRLTVSNINGILTSGDQIQIYEAVTTGGLVLVGTWTISTVSPTDRPRQPSHGAFEREHSLIIVTVVA
jgi:hypothetical protein